MNFAEALKTIREARKLTQTALALHAGIHIHSIEDLETGLLKPTKEIVAALCLVLDVPPQVLLFLAIEEEDVAEDKRAVYQQLHETMKGLIFELIIDKGNE